MTTTDNPQRVGVLGGTFNPVHQGHLMLARAALEAHDLSRIVFVPCARPAHKSGQELAPADDRAAMLDAAVADEPLFSVSRVELDREGISYTIDTVNTFRAADPRAEWFFIVGADSLPELSSWRRIGDLLERCRFIAMRRPGMPDDATLRARIDLPPPWPDRLIADLFDGHLIGISSTEIRKRVAENRSIRYLVPRDVEIYIHKHRLYKTV